MRPYENSTGQRDAAHLKQITVSDSAAAGAPAVGMRMETGNPGSGTWANLVPSAASQPFSPPPGHEQNWLIGFSKSGIGGQDLLLKHPDVFGVAASWDFPADMSSYNAFGSSSSAEYGTDANFQSNYRLSASFVDAHKAPFLTKNRIWIAGGEVFPGDAVDYNALLSSKGIAHTTGATQQIAHRWDSGWVPAALSALSQDSGALAASP